MIECANLAEAMKQSEGQEVTVRDVHFLGVFKADNADRIDCLIG